MNQGVIAGRHIYHKACQAGKSEAWESEGSRES